MKLECAEGMLATQAKAADIREAFADDEGRGEFIILSASEQRFIQASGVGDGPYTLEYREGGDRNHFQCVRDLTKTEVEAAFLKYFVGDETWRNSFEWKPLYEKPWWKFW